MLMIGSMRFVHFIVLFGVECLQAIHEKHHQNNSDIHLYIPRKTTTQVTPFAMPVVSHTKRNKKINLPFQATRLSSLRRRFPWELVLQSQPCTDVHAHELLHQQLSGVRHSHLDHTTTSLTTLAPALVTHETALLADVDLVRVRRQHETLEQ